MGNLSIGTQGASYYDWARKGKVYCAYASVTAPVIYSTAAGTGGPLLWNGSAAGSQVNAAILAVGVGVTTASGAASALGLTGNSGQTSAPSSTTTIDGIANLFIGGGIGTTPACTAYRVGTVTNAGNFFMPTHTLDTGAITTLVSSMSWVDIGGLVVVPPNSWTSVAAAATATSAVCKIGLIWVEIPI